METYQNLQIQRKELLNSINDLQQELKSLALFSQEHIATSTQINSLRLELTNVHNQILSLLTASDHLYE
jgi:hypothetical protein